MVLVTSWAVQDELPGNGLGNGGVPNDFQGRLPGRITSSRVRVQPSASTTCPQNEPAFGERSCFIKNDMGDLIEAFQHMTAADKAIELPSFCRVPVAARQGSRRGE